MDFIISYHRDEGIRRTSTITPQIEYSFSDLSLSLDDHMKTIYQKFKDSGITLENFNDCCLITSLEKPLINKNLLVQLVSLEDNYLSLSIHPTVKTKSIIELLKNNEKVKETVFYLKSKLENNFFSECFITNGGIPVLVDTATKSSGNTQSYTLAALHTALFHLQGIRVFLDTNDLTCKLYCLLSSSIVSVVRQILELLVLICTFDDKGAQKIIEASQKITIDENDKNLSKLVELVQSGDLDTQINSITLINSIIAASGNNKEERIKHFNEILDLETILHNVKHTESEIFKNQIRLYEDITKKTILDIPRVETKKKQKEFTQPIFPLMKREFNRAQRKMNDLLRNSDMLPQSVQTPLRSYARQLTQLDTNLSITFENESALQETISNLEKQVVTLQNKLKNKRITKSKDDKSETTENTKKRKKRHVNDSNKVLETKINTLTEQLDDKTKQLEHSLIQQQESANNVKKLAQVVKLMKSKYDALKKKVDDTNTEETSIKEQNITDISEITQIGYSCYSYNIPIQIQTEEVISITHEPNSNILNELKEENQQLRNKTNSLQCSLNQIAKLETLSSQIDKCILPNIVSPSPNPWSITWRSCNIEKDNSKYIWNTLPSISWTCMDKIAITTHDIDSIVKYINHMDITHLNQYQISILLSRTNEIEPQYDNYIQKIAEQIPNLYHRLYIWNSLNRYKYESEYIKQSIEIIKNAIKELKESQSLSICLACTLCVGNHITRTKTNGFYPDSLQYFSIENMNETSLIIEQICHLIKDKNPNIFNLLPLELVHLQQASYIDIHSLFSLLNIIKTNFYSKLFQDEYYNNFIDKNNIDNNILDSLNNSLQDVYNDFKDYIFSLTGDEAYSSSIPSQLIFTSFHNFMQSIRACE